jgi:ElaB/YqjD/DUF883 family membrane-anchored ribosome-binding protein
MTKNEILKKIGLSEEKVMGGKNFKRLMEKARQSKLKLKKAKQTFDKLEKKAEEYVEKNPKKAMAMAAAAGALAGSLLSAFKGNKPIQRKRKPKPTPAV